MTFLRMSCRGIQYLLRGADDDIFLADTAPRESRQRMTTQGAQSQVAVSDRSQGRGVYICCARPTGWAFWCPAVIGELACNGRAGLPPCFLIVDAFSELELFFFSPGIAFQAARIICCILATPGTAQIPAYGRCTYIIHTSSFSLPAASASLRSAPFCRPRANKSPALRIIASP